MRPFQVIALCAGLSAAFSWEGAFEDSAAKAVQGLEGIERLFRRQNEDNTDATTSGTRTTARTSATVTGTVTGTGTGTRTTGTKATGTITGSATRATGSRKASGSASGTGSAAATSIPVDARQPAGGVSMIVPDVFAGVQYYKAGDWVTFAWNYTSVVNAPSAVNVIATCSQINAEWTISGNMSYAPTQTVLWDTNQYAGKQTPQLVVASYTLIIENADEAKATGVPSPGELGSVNQLTFGMYTPQPYVPFSDFTCPMCNSAFGGKERQALGLMTTMVSFAIFTLALL